MSRDKGLNLQSEGQNIPHNTLLCGESEPRSALMLCRSQQRGRRPDTFIVPFLHFSHQHLLLLCAGMCTPCVEVRGQRVVLSFRHLGPGIEPESSGTVTTSLLDEFSCWPRLLYCSRFRFLQKIILERRGK